MIDITEKSTTLRIAHAKAEVVVSNKKTIKAIKDNKVPKGNVFEMAKTAGLFAAKNTHNSIPDCHPLPIESTAIKYEIKGLKIIINVEVKTIYKTGVEVEAMHASSIVALTIYDMLKPIDDQIEIQSIRLISKIGGKSSYKEFNLSSSHNASVVVCSDSISQGKKEDRAGKKIIEKLKKHNVQILNYKIIPDDKQKIQDTALKYSLKSDLIIFTGGTGMSIRDNTPEALNPILERRIPGVEEEIRRYGQERMPYAMLSRSLVGTIGKSIVIALPGSTKGAEESMNSIFPFILHVFKIFKGSRHD